MVLIVASISARPNPSTAAVLVATTVTCILGAAALKASRSCVGFRFSHHVVYYTNVVYCQPPSIEIDDAVRLCGDRSTPSPAIGRHRPMIALYYAANTCALASHIALEE